MEGSPQGSFRQGGERYDEDSETGAPRQGPKMHQVELHQRERQSEACDLRELLPRSGRASCFHPDVYFSGQIPAGGPSFGT
ncbi:hypothetical protein AA0323_1765 [Asaia siamensis NRIC 0323]|nr:hypothetical protein AA0323_1765 [Asaia siamensis NRIC 0323]